MGLGNQTPRGWIVAGTNRSSVCSAHSAFYLVAVALGSRVMWEGLMSICTLSAADGPYVLHRAYTGDNFLLLCNVLLLESRGNIHLQEYPPTHRFRQGPPTTPPLSSPNDPN